MNLNDVVDSMVHDMGGTKRDTREFLEKAFEVVGMKLLDLKVGEKLSITNFGTFKKVVRPARTCRNPQTGGTVEVPEHNVIKFRPAPAIKEEL